jgi:GNAT superfamily N-acetyltransferase
MSQNEYKPLCYSDISAIVTAFEQCGWSKPASIFEQYLREQDTKERLIWVAHKEEDILGYITLKWHSEYPLFKERNIPEIKDLNVLPDFRNQGVGSILLDITEAEAFERSDKIGIGVGLYPDYGAAQRLYVKRGYIPDGKGITYEHRTLLAGESIVLDDELILWMVKEKQNA